MSSFSDFFSVVIPCFNAENKIQRTLHSLLKQTDSNFETILVLDGCTDNTLRKVEELIPAFTTADKKIIVVNNTINSGPARCRNLGWDKATGSYVLFLDADDEFLPNKIEVTKLVLQKLNGPAALGHQAQLPDLPASETGEIYQLKFSDFLKRNRIFTPCLIVRASMAERFDESMRYCEDYDLLLRLSYKYDVFFLEKALTIVHRQPLTLGGLSGQHYKMRLGEMKAFAKLPLLNLFFIVFTPFLLAYSALKYARFLVFRTLGII